MLARKTPAKRSAKAAPKRAAKPVTLGELVAILGEPFDDPGLIAIVERLGRKPPNRSTAYIDAKPHGVSFSLESDAGPRRLLELCFHVTKSPDAGEWTGELPEGLTRDSKPEHVTHGTRTDTPAKGEFQPAETQFMIEGAGTTTFVVFADGVLEHVNLAIGDGVTR